MTPSPYVLATPVKNEFSNLPRLLSAVGSQRHRPCCWVVVDDGSTDGSRAWLEREAAARPWLVVIPSPEVATEYLGGHVARVKRAAVEHALRCALGEGHEPAYAAVLDADLAPEPSYYQEILGRMDAQPRLGVASGVVVSPGEGGGPAVERFQRLDLPRGGVQVFRSACLHEIGGLPPYPGYDGIANVLAGLRGWQRRLYPDLVVPQSRPTATRFGPFAGYRRKGHYAWFLDLHPSLVVARTAIYAARRPRRQAVGFLVGWAESAGRRVPRCPDADVRRYYRRERPREYLRAAWSHVRGGGGSSFVDPDPS